MASSAVNSAIEKLANLQVNELFTSSSPNLQKNLSILSPNQIELGKMLLEIGQGHLFEHWPDPGVDDDHKLALLAQGSSDDFSDANAQLALAVVRKLQEIRETRACIVFPDKPEKRSASELFKSAIDLIDGITIGSLDDIPTGPVVSFFRSIRNTLDFDFDDDNEGRWQSDKPPSLFVFICCSTRELATIETYLVG